MEPTTDPNPVATDASSTPPMAEEDILRADFYDFLSGLLGAAPDADKLAALGRLTGDDTDIGEALRALAAVARARTSEEADREFHDLFIGVGRGELQPYASVYMTGFLNEKPLARLRADMLRLGMARADTVFEPEDNVASLFEMMAGLIRGRFGPAASVPQQAEFFNAHIAPWAGPFFADLESAKAATLYAPIGRLGGLLIDIEREAFRLGAGDA